MLVDLFLFGFFGLRIWASLIVGCAGEGMMTMTRQYRADVAAKQHQVPSGRI
jgi:hypothetical protein